MKKRTNPFRKPARPQQEETPLAKSASQMSDAELDASLREARRDLLDIRHEELRERERARVAPEGSERTKRNLGEIFGKNNRRFK